jgi:HPt (histidine-containing phosphotransfer) domain-containing protein
MNYKELVENLGLDKNEFMELVEIFIEAGLSDLSKLKDAIDKKNVLQVIETAHSIKGAEDDLGFV